MRETLLERFTTARLRARTKVLIGGFVALFAASTATAAVTVDQSPLFVQQTLPPNIVLMFDDSGSMDWDYMPDWGYLTSTTGDSLRNSSVNGTYYNPSVTYTPPPTKTGGSYGDSPSITSAYKDGFLDLSSDHRVDVTQYSGPDYDNTKASDSFPFYTRFSVPISSAAPPAACDAGDSVVTSGSKNGQCENRSCTLRGCSSSYYSPYPHCSSGSYDSSSGMCVTNVYKFFFTYTTGSGNTKHYVSGTDGDCALLSSSDSSNCTDSVVVRQNVANWFSYYRTRMLMAKTGLLSAFADLNSDYRVGFGSINGNNNSGLPSNKASYGTNNTFIAPVAPFGNGTSSTSQKANFWSWVAGSSPNDSTPLRTSLDAVGRYYKTDQPWSTMSSDPDPDSTEELACRQSFTILTTDGFWNGNTPSDIGDVDGSTGPTITGPSSQPYTYSPALPYADGGTQATSYDDPSCARGSLRKKTSNPPLYACRSGSKNNYSWTTPTCSEGQLSTDQQYCVVTTSGNSDTLADVAMKYWQTDLRGATDNEVPTSTADPAFWQHMTTFTLGLGFEPLYADQETPIPMDDVFNWAQGGDAIDGFAWPKPAGSGGSGGSINNIADLAHAAVNGHGGFYSAKTPEAFTSGLKDALKRASERNGTGASLAANSTKLETGTVTYQAFYRTAVWTGDLVAYNIDPDTGAISDHANWSASEHIPTTGRTITTYNKDASGSKFVAFADPSTLSTAQQTALGSDATSRQHMIDYLRGDTSLEVKNGGSYRNRSTALGDIVDSQPVYVGAPDPNLFYGKSFTGSSTYSTFASDKTSRTPIIWVAANDGMLHGFNASTGAEVYAYLPGAVIVGDTSDTSTTRVSYLANLANTNYGTTAQPHQYFNDGETTVADVYLGSSKGWRTVIVGTTGRGPARAIYAIDITNPASPSPLWERSAGDGKTNSGYIGQIVGKPVIAQTADGTWSVLVGNGYNSTNNKAALLQFTVSDGTLTVHAAGTATDNGLASPAVWMASATDGISTTAYAGDLKGNVWSFDLSDSDSDGTLLFTAKDSGDHAQSITAGMLIGKDPKTGYLWLFFGTGRYLTQSELSDADTQSWYGIIVQATDTPALVTDLSTKARSETLVQRSIIGEVAATDSSLAARAVSTPNDAGMSGKSGWYIDLTSPTSGAQGERMVTPNQFQGTLLIGTTRVPESSDPCNPSGSGWIMAIDPFTGRGPSSVFFDLNNDTKFDNSDKITVGGVTYAAAGVGFSAVPNNPIFVGNVMEISFDNAKRRSVNTAGTVGIVERLSWRELIAK